MARYYFTSESVTEGHPDKICDQIADATLDAVLEKDPDARVACECCCTTGMILVMGEITAKASVDIPKIARKVVADIGYDDADYGFDFKTCAVLTAIDEQSSDIAMGVDRLGAGDQGIMFGYACDETPELMPAPISLANKICAKLAEVRKNGEMPRLRPDGKSQVTVEYDENDRPVRAAAIVVSAQHSPDAELSQLKKDIIEKVVKSAVPANMLDDETVYYINPTGRFVIGGPLGDSGLTGRKIIADSYGGYARNGGGALSGKDPTKVDRSAAYAARYAAKNIVAAGLAKKCEVEIAYAIGVERPVSIFADAFGTGKVSNSVLSRIIEKEFDFRPASIIRDFDLKRPIYRRIAVLGQVGRTDVDLPWEKTDKVAAIKKAAKI